MTGGSTQPERPGRLDSLTGLRFFAAALVLVHHYSYVLMPGTLAERLSAAGFVGVSFFFILSGFVLMWTFDPGVKARHFYGRRVARVYPLHILTTLVALALLLDAVIEAGAWRIVPNLLLVQAWNPAESFSASINMVSWSLSNEIFFYLLFPLIARVALRGRVKLGAALTALFLVTVPIVASLLFGSAAGDFLYAHPAYRIGEFVLGILIAVAVRDGFRPRLRMPIAVLIAAASYFLALGTGFVAVVAGGLPGELLRPLVAFITIPGSIALIFAALASDLGARRSTLLRSRPVIILGEASFALYLVHHLVMDVGVAVLGAPESLRVATLLFAVFAIASVLLSVALFRWLERPLERVLRRRFGAPRRRPEKSPELPDAASVTGGGVGVEQAEQP